VSLASIEMHLAVGYTQLMRTKLYAGALIVEACVLAILWLVGRYFGG
jgi:hypothetical protein